MSVYDVNGTTLEHVYNVDKEELGTAYNVNGNIIHTVAVDYSDYSISDYCMVSLSPTQGFDIFNGVIFQFMASSSISNRMATINAVNSAIINENIPSVSDHGDSASFSNKVYDYGDEFPLLYVTSDTYPKVYVNRVTRTTSQLVKTLVFPSDKVGYYTAFAIDEDNSTGYMVGYTEENYLTDDDGNNEVLISKWDMSDLTQNQDGSYTPAFVSFFEIPFIYCMQGLQFHDGMIWISSGGTNVRGYVYALDPTDGDLLYTIDTNTTTEVEGIAFLPDGSMVFGLQGGTYKKVTFADAS